jgi:hypothetical protein
MNDTNERSDSVANYPAKPDSWLLLSICPPRDSERLLWCLRGYGCFNPIITIGYLEDGFVYGENGFAYHLTKETCWMPLPAPPAGWK